MPLNGLKPARDLMESLTSFFANNVILTLLIVVFLVFGVLRGGLFASGIVRAILVVLLVVMGLRACADHVTGRWEASSKSWAQDASEPMRWLACKLIGLDAACSILQMAEAPAAADERRLQCINTVLTDLPYDGGYQVRAACAVQREPAVWESCVKREMSRYEKLAAEVETRCLYSRSSMGRLIADVIKPIACPMGITALCQTNDAPAVPSKPVGQPRETFSMPRIECLSDAIARHGVQITRCPNTDDKGAWGVCLEDVMRSSSKNAEEWINWCKQQPG